MNSIHQKLKPPYFKVFNFARDVFTEGDPAFPRVGIQKKRYNKICDRNMKCIKGFLFQEKSYQIENLAFFLELTYDPINYSAQSYLKGAQPSPKPP